MTHFSSQAVTLSQKEYTRLVKLASSVSVIMAISIIGFKLAAWLATDSLSLLSSLADSVFDVLCSLLNFFIIRVAIKPADEDHRFGHGKAEDIATLIQSAFIAGSGLFIIIEALNRILNKTQIENPMIGIWVMVLSTLLTLILLSVQNYVIKKTGSNAIRADSMHYRTDLFVNLLVLISFYVIKTFSITWFDTVLAIFISLYIFYSAFTIAKTAIDNLMDKEFSDIDRKKIIDAVFLNKEVRGMHDLRTRRSGSKVFIQFHLEMEANISLLEAHNICKKTENLVKNIFQNAEILIHQDIGHDMPMDPHLGRVVPVKNS